MKKIIPFIASGYKKDKIWLRKSIPEEKNYRILVALDNSSSMQEQQVGQQSLISLSVLSLALF